MSPEAAKELLEVATRSVTGAYFNGLESALIQLEDYLRKGVEPLKAISDLRIIVGLMRTSQELED